MIKPISTFYDDGERRWIARSCKWWGCQASGKTRQEALFALADALKTYQPPIQKWQKYRRRIRDRRRR